MNNIKTEIELNFERYFNQISDEYEKCTSDLSTCKDRYKESYTRIVSINAWRETVIIPKCSADAESFFREAHNDIISAHSLARQGAWRVSLMSLRSFIENSLFGLYYMDHSIELQLWILGKHKLGFTECINYLSEHPGLRNKELITNILAELKEEYATLSKAVHGSSNNFRMSNDGKVFGVSSIDKAKLGSWLTRERAVLHCMNVIFIAFFYDSLSGARNLHLRKTMSLSIRSSTYASIKSTFNVNLLFN